MRAALSGAQLSTEAAAASCIDVVLARGPSVVSLPRARAPNINIFRDPRWGRGQETPGEDPTINGEYGAAYVKGMQGDEATNGYLRTSACLKHYAAYSEETDRESFAAVVTAQDMEDTCVTQRTRAVFTTACPV